MAIGVEVSGEWGEGNDIAGGDCGVRGISRSHAAAYSHLDGVELVALCDINQVALEERANEHGVAGRYGDYEEMFKRERLDVVSVCTHAPLHMPVTLAAARAGVTCCARSRWRSIWSTPTGCGRRASRRGCSWRSVISFGYAAVSAGQEWIAAGGLASCVRSARWARAPGGL